MYIVPSVVFTEIFHFLDPPASVPQMGYNPCVNDAIPRENDVSMPAMQRLQQELPFPPENMDVRNQSNGYFHPNMAHPQEMLEGNLDEKNCAFHDPDQMLELSPEEAAEVVNHLLMSRPFRNRNLTSQVKRCFIIKRQPGRGFV